MKSEGKKYTINVTEFDIKILLEALGSHQNRQLDRRQSAKATENVIQKIYRAMGVRL